MQFPDGETWPARVISSVSYADIAMLRLTEKPDNLQPVRLGDSDKLKIGEELFVVGAPYGLQFTFTAGHFSSRRDQEETITGEPLSPCPFLREEDSRFACAIHPTRPRKCREVLPAVSPLCPQCSR